MPRTRHSIVYIRREQLFYPTRHHARKANEYQRHYGVESQVKNNHLRRCAGDDATAVFQPNANKWCSKQNT